MKKISEIIIAVASSKPHVEIESVQVDGDVLFHVKLDDLFLDPEDCSNPIMKTRFFANFAGEFIVRTNMDKFASILTGLDSALYNKMICSSQHSDFGMMVDYGKGRGTFQMHMSLVQDVMTEDFGRPPSHGFEALPGDDIPFEIGGYLSHTPDEEEPSSED